MWVHRYNSVISVNPSITGIPTLTLISTVAKMGLPIKENGGVRGDLTAFQRFGFQSKCFKGDIKGKKSKTSLLPGKFKSKDSQRSLTRHWNARHTSCPSVTLPEQGTISPMQGRENQKSWHGWKQRTWYKNRGGQSGNRKRKREGEGAVFLVVMPPI